MFKNRFGAPWCAVVAKTEVEPIYVCVHPVGAFLVGTALELGAWSLEVNGGYPRLRAQKELTHVGHGVGWPTFHAPEMA